MTRPSDVSNMEARITEIGQELEELRNEREHIRRHVHSMEHDERMKRVSNRYSELAEEIAVIIEQRPKIRESPPFLRLLSSIEVMEMRMVAIWAEFRRLRKEEINLRVNVAGAKQQEGYEKNRNSIAELSKEIETMLGKFPEIRKSRPFRGLVSDIEQWRFDDSMTNSSGFSSGIFGLGSSSLGRVPNDDRSDSLNPNSHRYNPGKKK